MYFTYMITNRTNGTIYIGMTNNLQRRISEHKEGKISGFAKKYGLHRLVYYESFSEVKDAIYREKVLKKWNRVWKIRLIEKNNPDWKDLSNQLWNLS